MSGQSPQDGFWHSWLPSPQYSESGWNNPQSPPGSNPRFFHYNDLAAPSPTKLGQPRSSQTSHIRPSNSGNMTPGSTPSSQQGSWQPSRVPSQQLHGQGVSGSFMQQFDDAHLEDPFVDDPSLNSTLPAFPLQTPPPTRGSSKRKPHQPRLPEFATPPTVRHSAVQRPASAGFGQSPNHLNFSTDASPFSFTPLQFSPPSHSGFAPSGPMTAPAQPAGVFWDPNSTSSGFEPPLPSIAEDPFTSPAVHPSNSFSFSSPGPIQHRYTASESFPQQYYHSATRPQPARPATAAPNHSMHAGIDPNILRTSQARSGQPETYRLIAPNNNTPYATQKADLQRERAARAKKQTTRPSVRHTVTDTAVPRSESPLKRQKSNAHPPMGTFITTPRRREVVLTVDEHGHASTKMVGDPLPPGRYSLQPQNEGEEDSDTEEDARSVSDATAAIKAIPRKK